MATLGHTVNAAALPDLPRVPRAWWLLVAGVWFALLSEIALMLFDAFAQSTRRFSSDPIAIWIAVGTFAAGMLSWWSTFRAKSRVLGNATSLGLGAAIVGLIVNPYAWFISIATFMAFPLVYGAVLVAGGIALYAAYQLVARVWPNSTVERDARKSGARPSP
jgi:hypothetical protein